MSGDKGLNPVIVSVCRFAGIASVSLAVIFLINNFITYVGGFMKTLSQVLLKQLNGLAHGTMKL